MWAFNAVSFVVLFITHIDALTLQEQKECLDSHNKLRALHGSGAMTWSNELARNAQQWADHLADRVKALQHSPKDRRSGQGENLYFAGHSGCDVRTCADAVHSWYEEYKNYNYNTHKQINRGGEAVGHFTQVVWKASTTLGMGIAVRKEGSFTKYYIVARYQPQGNYNQMKYGESVEQGRLRNWRENVPRRLPGTSVPSAKSLRNGEYADSCGQKGDCKDQLADQCRGKERFCNNSPSILKYCKKTCKKCGNGNTGSGNQGGGNKNCRDLNTSCPAYKSHCSNPGGNVASVCPKTCGTC